MKHDPTPMAPSSMTTDFGVEPIRPGNLRSVVRDSTKHQWLVQFDGREELVDADVVEITPSGDLVFYRAASRMEQERTLTIAFSQGLRWRCELVTERGAG